MIDRGICSNRSIDRLCVRYPHLAQANEDVVSITELVVEPQLPAIITVDLRTGFHKVAVLRAQNRRKVRLQCVSLHNLHYLLINQRRRDHVASSAGRLCAERGARCQGNGLRGICTRQTLEARLASGIWVKYLSRCENTVNRGAI